MPQKEKDKLVFQALESVGLLDAIELVPNELSGDRAQSQALLR